MPPPSLPHWWLPIRVRCFPLSILHFEAYLSMLLAWDDIRLIRRHIDIITNILGFLTAQVDAAHWVFTLFITYRLQQLSIFYRALFRRLPSILREAITSYFRWGQISPLAFFLMRLSPRKRPACFSRYAYMPLSAASFSATGQNFSGHTNTRQVLYAKFMRTYASPLWYYFLAAEMPHSPLRIIHLNFGRSPGAAAAAALPWLFVLCLIYAIDDIGLHIIIYIIYFRASLNKVMIESCFYNVYAFSIFT